MINVVSQIYVQKISQWDATNGDFFTLNIQSLSKVSQFFFEKTKSDLINEYNNETILLFRKHNYEKILNQYLENRYDIDNLEFSIIISEKEKNKLEHISKQELKERNIEEQIKKQIKKQEDKLIKKIGISLLKLTVLNIQQQIKMERILKYNIYPIIKKKQIVCYCMIISH